MSKTARAAGFALGQQVEQDVARPAPPSRAATVRLRGLSLLEPLPCAKITSPRRRAGTAGRRRGRLVDGEGQRTDRIAEDAEATAARPRSCGRRRGGAARGPPRRRPSRLRPPRAAPAPPRRRPPRSRGTSVRRRRARAGSCGRQRRRPLADERDRRRGADRDRDDDPRGAAGAQRADGGEIVSPVASPSSTTITVRPRTSTGAAPPR